METDKSDIVKYTETLGYFFVKLTLVASISIMALAALSRLKYHTTHDHVSEALGKTNELVFSLGSIGLLILFPMIILGPLHLAFYIIIVTSKKSQFDIRLLIGGGIATILWFIGSIAAVWFMP